MSATFLGTPNSFTFRGFQFYRGRDVKKGKGGFAWVTLPNGKKAWGTAGINPHCHGGIGVSFLGWGDSPVCDWTDFSKEDQAVLRETLE